MCIRVNADSFFFFFTIPKVNIPFMVKTIFLAFTSPLGPATADVFCSIKDNIVDGHILSYFKYKQ